MTLINKILALVSDYIEKSKKGSHTQKTLLSLKTEISALVDDSIEKTVNKDTAYICAICQSISLSLREKKYCRDCYDKYID